MAEKQKTNTRSRKYLLTINNPTEHYISHDSIMEALKKYRTKYIAMCDETGGKEHTFHMHVFLYFENAISFLSVKKLFPSANIQSALGTAAENKAYLLKSDPKHNKKSDGSYEYTDSSGRIHSGINHTETFFETGDCPIEKQGRRSDLEYMYALVKDGYNNAEILELCPETAIKHIDKINKLRHAYLTDKFKGQRRLDLKVNYISGITGSGKTRDILDEYGDENVYRITDYMHPFDSYQNEPVIVFEEYRTSIRLQDMLNYLDIYPVTLPARYSPKVACYTTVFVVSNWAFEQQYAELQKDDEQKSSYAAWVRRFNGYVKIYTDAGITTYPTMQDYLRRNEEFHPVQASDTPFMNEPEPQQVSLKETENAGDAMPFDD